MTPADFKSARHALGLSAEGFAKLVRVQSGRTVRRWESGDSDIPGPVTVLLTAALESAAVRNYFGLTLRDNGRK
jgi:DNA-binding transcriptional regulator YiaG